MKEKINYEEAMRETEKIVAEMENNSLDIDSLTEKLKRAQTLLAACRDKLTKTDREINRLLGEDGKEA